MKKKTITERIEEVSNFLKRRSGYELIEVVKIGTTFMIRREYEEFEIFILIIEEACK